MIFKHDIFKIQILLNVLGYILILLCYTDLI